ncbi:MAG TPA: MFS transporter, partial [Candidatus Udaeobacter sp.]|nr:MFS transporter [Candidatus Udaeobacter sp.]
MSSQHLEILARRRFLPLFVTQFMGALNDNLFKNALVILVTFRLAAEKGVDAGMMATFATGLFILPFFLFSATAGRLADKFEKQRLIAIIKAAEIAIMLLAGLAFSVGNLTLLMSVLFLMGTHSTFFGPLKYGILPQHLPPEELLSGNAVIEAGTFLAILIGTIAGGLLILTANGILLVVTLEIVVAAAGLLASLFIPRAPAAAPDLKLGLNFLAHGWEMIREAKSQRVIWLAILGISWFWLVGATFLAQFPAFAKTVLGAGNGTVTLMLVAFSVGIAIGSMLCNWLLKGEVSARYVPLGALGISLFTFDLYAATAHMQAGSGVLLDVAGFLARPSAWRVLGDLTMIAVSAGFYIVPLNTLLQARSEESHRSRVIAANNIVNALFMVLGATGAVAMLAFHCSIPQIFLALALLNLPVALYICRLLPETVIKGLVGGLLRLAYGAEVHGLANWPAPGERVVVVANHVSFLDAVLLAALLPGRPTFAVNSF